MSIVNVRNDRVREMYQIKKSKIHRNKNRNIEKD